ncbi:non-ribosomal peptide synthetase/MFS transporter [Actinomadura terrae]|uniref:non-ribosomal peptide synthetase/MFS transporter n=1 Tax=Actinomadura terrae TaxID=604353 RepID=UPI001FA77101|nr:non-ribosomal peptide synthetase/MFS transporter [Actinomadura terrae]
MTETSQDRLAALVRSRLAAARAEVRSSATGIPALGATEMELSPAQARLAFLAQLEPDSAAYNVPVALRLDGPLDTGALRAAVGALAERHWILRGVIDGGTVSPVGEVPVPMGAFDDAALADHAWRPFRLDAEPPMRAALFHVADDTHVLALTFHHIVTDAWSEGLLLEELSALYAARLGLAPEPEPPALHYADVAAFEAGRPDTDPVPGGGTTPHTPRNDLDWWTERLAGLPPVLDLPTDRPRPAVASWRGASVPVALPAALSARVRAVPDATPFMVLLAGLQALLARLSGETDIAVGVPHAGRHHPDAERVVGPFVNTLVVRGDTSGDPSGAELVRRARDAALDAFAHARTPFQDIVERLRPDRSLSSTPLFQVMLNVYDGGARTTLPGVTVRPEPLPAPTAKFDLNLSLADDGERFSGQLLYRADLYDEATVERMVAWYVALLDGMLADPAAPVRLPEGDDLRGPVRDVPVDAPLHALVERAADAAPEVLAVGTLSYAELDRRANQVAHWLLDRGTAPQEPVAVLMERSPELVVALLGVLKAGAAYLPLDPVYPRARTEAVLADSGARTVLTEAEVAAAADRPVHRPDVAVPPDHLAYVVYTSGSTGEPKGVAVEHRHIAHYLGAVGALIPDGVASFALVSTASADLGLTNLWGALVRGAALHMIGHETATDPDACAAYLDEHPVDAIKMVPSQLELLGMRCLPRRLLILAGEAVPGELLARVRAARPDLAVQVHYGPTETTVSVLASEVTDLSHGVAPLGRPLVNVACRVVDATGRAVPAGVPGELWIGGPSVARGYLGRTELTARRFAGGWYRTGDRVRVGPSGLVEFLGRLDDQVKVRGFRVELGEVGSALRALPEVAEAFVLPVGDGAARRLAAWITPSGEGPLDVAAVRAALRERLPDHMVPAAIAVLAALPLTPNGKVDRAALPVPETAAEGRRPLATPQELLVAEAWAEVLEVGAVAADDDFFALGGHSFAATRVAARLREELGAAVPVRLLFEHPVLADLAAALPVAGTADDVVIRPVSDRLSPAQARLWFLAQLEPDSTAYNVPLVLRLTGPLDVAALLAAVRDLAERHTVLRSVIDDSGPEPVLVARPAEAVPVEVRRTGSAAEELARPFALDVEPPMRAALFVEDGDRAVPGGVGGRPPTRDRHILALTFHHIATDVWTRGLIQRELAELYAARLGLRGPLEPPPYQYSQVAPAEDEAGLDWWEQTLAGLPPVLDLPADRPRPPVAADAGAAVELELPAALSDRVREVAAAHRATPFIVLMAGLQALLARLSNGTDIAVGVPVAGRDHPGTEDVVGCFLNTVVVRGDLSGDPTGREVLDRTRQAAIGALTHARTPFEWIVDRLRPERNLAATPLFQVLLNCYPAPPPPALSGLEVTELHLAEDSSKFDLNWHVVDSGAGTPLRGGLSYRVDLFDDGTAARFARWFLTLLDGMLADLDAPVGAVPLEPVTGPALAGPTATPVDVPVHRLIERWVDEAPDAPAVVGADRALSYAELEERANRVAGGLLAAGVRPDEPVGVLLEPGADLACALFGIEKSGGGYLPMDPAYPPARIHAMIAAAGVRTVVAAPEFTGLLPPEVTALVPDALPPAARPDVDVRTDHLHHVIFTSGSTGTPKAVAVEHRSVTGYLAGMLPAIDVPGGSFAVVSTPAADFGLTCVFGALTTGGTVHLVARETAMDPAAFAGYLREHAVDVVKCVPSHLELLASGGDLAAVLPRTLLVLAGEACPWDLVERARAARPGLRIQSHYGHTESTMICLVCDTAEVPPERRTGIVPLGRPLPGVYGHLVDAALRPVPPGVPGELVVGGPGVTRGYIGLPELTAARFVADPVTGEGRCYRSGDLLRVAADGTVEFRGRVDDQVKVRGYRVELGEVTAALRDLPEVDEAVVLPVGEGRSRRLAAWLTPGGVDVASVRAALRDRLPDYMVPAQFVPLERLPLNPNGKIDRAALPAPRVEATRSRPPGTPSEHRVAAAFAAVLEADGVGADDDFFALGGDSFAAVRAVKEIGGGLRVIDLFTRPTVAGLAAFLDARDTGGTGLLHKLGGGRRPEFTLVCVPYGGGSAAVYHPLAQALGDAVEVLAVEPPGHDPARPDEAPIPIAELVDRLAPEVASAASGPVVVYGHCVGSAPAVALARRLEADGVPVLGVVAAGSFPAARLPGLAQRLFRGERLVSDRMFRDALRATGGLLDDMDEAAKEAAVRAMRHDAEQARSWFGAELAEPGRALDAPILCLVGERDRATELYQERHAEWAVFSPRVDLAVLPRAGHYFLRHQAEPLAAVLAEHARRWKAGHLPEPVRRDERTGLRPFYTVAAGQFVSVVGNALSSFALGVWAYQRSGRIVDLALVVMLAQIPTVLLSPLGGALADRVDRRRIMLACNAVSGVAMAALVLLLATDHLALWNVCLIVGLTSLVTAFHEPAYLAAIAQLVPKPYLPQANALANAGFGIGNVVAPLVGGALIGLVGLSWVVAIDVASFAIGVLTLAAVRFPDRLFHRREETFAAALAGGWRFLRHRRPLLVMAGYFAVVNFCTAMMWVLITPIVLAIGSPTALGLVTAVGGLGAAAGTAVVLVWGGTKRRATGMIGFVVGSGIGVVAMGAWPVLGLVAAGLFVRLACMSIGNAHWLSILQVKVGPELQGRVMAINIMLATAMQPLGFLSAGWLADWAQPHTSGPGRGAALVLLASGVLLVGWGLLGLRYRPLRHLEDLVPDAAPPPEADADLDAVQNRVLAA